VGSAVEQRRARDDRHFDRWARRYDRSLLQTILFGPVQRSVVDALAPHVPAEGAVLDIGCGTGRLLDLIGRRRPGAALVGVDRSERMAGAAHGARPRLRVERGTAESLPHRDATFDVVVTTVSFHGWSDKPAALREVFRVLRPGGLFALTDVTSDDVPARPQALWGPVRRRLDDQPPIAERERLLRDGGFEVLEERPTFHGRWVPCTLARHPAG
jgi:ubiquinone/menaquinone biosynthesis C-methylase UbiE